MTSGRSGGDEPTFCVDSNGEHGYNSGSLGVSVPNEHKDIAECVDWHEQNFAGKDLRGLFMAGVNLEKANLSGARLQGSFISVAELYSANFSNADLSELLRSDVGLAPAISIEGGKTTQIMTRPTELSGSDATRANFTGANLSKAQLGLSNFSCANFSNANLSEIEAVNAIFSRAYFVGARFNGAGFSSTTRFDGANLSGADLTGVHGFPKLDPDLKDMAVIFKGAIFDDKTKMPWSRAHALEVGMIEAKSAKAGSGSPGTQVPTKDNCDIVER